MLWNLQFAVGKYMLLRSRNNQIDIDYFLYKKNHF